MTVSFSVHQRGADFADLAIPFYTDPSPSQEVAQAYVVERASNWDGAFAPLTTLPMTGARSKSVDRLRAGSSGSASQWRNRLRWVFNPADYSLSDSEIQWFRIVPQLAAGPAPAGPILAMLPAGLYRQAYFPLVLTGTAPIAPVTLRLPRTSTALTVRAISGTTVVGLSAGGAGVNSIVVTAGGALAEYSNNNINFDTLVLSDGGDVEITCALGNRIA
jgi:hypothetical protein